MVARYLKYAFAMMLTLLITMMAGIIWMLWTPSGSAWLLDRVVAWSPLKLSVQRIDGRLADQLQLEGLQLVWPQGALAVQQISLDWSLVNLFSGTLEVAELSLSGVDILLDTPPSDTAGSRPRGEPFVFAWPDISGWPLWLTATFTDLQCDHLVIRSPETILWQIERLHSSILWKSGTFTLSELALVAQEGSLDGRLSVDLLNAQLGGEVRLALAESIADVNRGTLKFDLSAANGSQTLSGRLESLLSAGPKDWFDVAADVALTGDVLQVADGTILFPGHSDRLEVRGELYLREELPWQAQVRVDRLDLTELAGVPLQLFGQVQGSGDLDEYRGVADVENRVDGWLKSQLQGAFDGNLDGIGLSGLSGRWLGGQVAGDLTIGWLDGFSLRGNVQGRDLDLARLLPEWPGQVNLNLQAELLQLGDAPLSIDFIGELLDSTLHGKELAGGVNVHFQGEEVDVGRLDLHGEGIDLTAAGRLSERLDFSASAERLSGVVPGLAGKMDACGWVRREAEELSGHLQLQGKDLHYGGLSLQQLTLGAEKPQRNSRFQIQAEGRAGYVGDGRIDSFAVTLNGLPEDHEGTLTAMSPAGTGRMAWTGGYLAGRWDGRVNALQLNRTLLGDWSLTREVAVQIGSAAVQLAPMKLVSSLGESLELDGLMSLSPLDGVAQLRWGDLRLSHAESWLSGWQAKGATSGDLQLHLQEDDRLDLSVAMKMAGALTRGKQLIETNDGSLALVWNQRGLSGEMKADFGELGRVSAQVRSAEPARQGFPGAGEFSIGIDDLGLNRLYAWTPSGVEIEGQLSATTRGRWENTADLQLQGEARVAGGRLHWQAEDGMLEAELRQATFGWDWHGDGLSGQVVLLLNDHGRLQGELALPLSAHWPFAIDASGPVRGRLYGALQEQGLLTALFPASLRETSGQLELDWTLGGIWEHPDLGGLFSLSGASAYLPSAGIQLEDVGFKGRLAQDRIFLESFFVKSGKGRLEGSGDVQLANWQPKEYRFQLDGDDFQLINLPELQLTVNPELQLSGDPQRIKLRGTVTIPQALVAASSGPTPVSTSSDVVFSDAHETPPPKGLPVALDAQVKVLLGKSVLVKANGIDARLGGEVELQATALDEVLARGKINVVQGAYSTYGVGLNIERGNLLFAGGPVDRPTLDILALRKAGEVKAGVQVTGTPRQPLAKLYSEPLMPDTDILAYIVLGRPLGSDSGQSDLLLTAAGALLSKGESAVLQERLKRRLGFDVLEVQAGNGDVASSVVTVGKYLNPKLYVSFGHALFTNTNEFRLRYTLAERWELESNVGLESGADLYYRIEFD